MYMINILSFKDWFIDYEVITIVRNLKISAVANFFFAVNTEDIIYSSVYILDSNIFDTK